MQEKLMTAPLGTSHGQFLQAFWPEEFTKRRKACYQEENEAYIQFLQADFSRNGEGDSDEGDAEGNLLTDCKDNVAEEEVQDYQEKIGDHGGTRNNNDTKPCKKHDNVITFMKGMAGEEEYLPYQQQVEKVSEFCKLATLELKTKPAQPAQSRKNVALLDDRNIGGSTIDNKKGQSRPYLGPLTSQQLLQELKKKRFRAETGQNASTDALENRETDAERRLIFINDLDASTIEALIVTASRSQAPTLRNLIYRHLTATASVGVDISSRGFPVFSLEFHIPCFMLREDNNGVLEDSRKTIDGTPLRKSWEFPFLSRSISTSTSISTDKPCALYEAQVSVAVTGLNDGVWTAYGIFDTYFDTKEAVDSYHQLSTTRGRQRGRVDPLAAGQLNADKPIWTPRDYFFKVFAIRIKGVLKEWNLIVEMVDREVERSRTFQFPLSTSDQSRQTVRNFSNWNQQFVKLLIQLINRLSDTVEAWNKFQGKDIEYFLDSESPSLKPSLVAVANTFSELKILLLKLERLRKEVRDNSPQGVFSHLSLENSEAAIFQRRTARHVEILTILSIVFSPIYLAASIFSTQGVLPFTPSLPYFIYTMVVLTALLVTTLIVSSNWTLWMHRLDWTAKYFQQLFGLQRQARKDSELYDEIQDRNRTRGMSKSRVLKWGWLPGRLKRADFRQWDLESGCGEPLIGTPEVKRALETPGLPSNSSCESLHDPLSSLMGWDGPPKSKQRKTLPPKHGGLSDNRTAVVDPSASTVIRKPPGSSGHQYRLSEMDEDLLYPARYKTKLTGLQACVCRGSGIAQQSLEVGGKETSINPGSAFLLQECQKFLTWILQNVDVLRDAGFCSSTVTFLRIDPKRNQVALLESVELDKVVQLETWIDKTKTSLESLQRLDSACNELFGDHLALPASPAAGNIAIMSLRILDLVLASHVCSHVGDLGRLISQDTSRGRKFQISSKASSMVDLSAPSEPGTMSFSRRTLKCLNGFLCGQQVWVLHGPDIDPMDPSELFLSTAPDVFADVWGPMWKIVNAGKPTEVLRYDLEHGSVVPFGLISGSGRHFVKTEPNEELCHWIPNRELENFERALASASPPQIGRSQLLIGACRHSVIPNPEKCYCNLADVNSRFVSKGYRRILGLSPTKWVTESMTVGTTAGGAGLGAPTFNFSHTMKKEGTPVKEAFHKRWKNNAPSLRPWRYLLMRYGLQLSVCPGNSRKVRIVDLIAGDTMKEFMKTYPSYTSEPWREAFEEMLRTNPAKLVTFQADNPTEREGFEKYITACLDGLVRTGMGSRTHDPFVALWVYNSQPWEIAFPRQRHAWAGFVEDGDSMCSFIVLEKCLINPLGLRCCHPREDMSEEEIERMRRSTPAVLETFLTISDQCGRPDGLRLLSRPDGRLHWSVGDLWNRKHYLKLGKRGTLEGESFCSSGSRWNGSRYYSKRVLTGKWSPEGTIAAATRLLSPFIIAPPETHTEHECDGLDNEPPPLSYLILDGT